MVQSDARIDIGTQGARIWEPVVLSVAEPVPQQISGEHTSPKNHKAAGNYAKTSAR